MSEVPELQQRQRSVSPVLSFSPEARQVHQEHAKSSEPLRNNAVVLEMLKSMRQEMQERDNQLKVQLQLRDEVLS